jgi:hypothetical protein
MKTMMNLLALSLLVSSLAAAGVWSPSPDSKPQSDQEDGSVIVRDGHRAVVVEYDENGHHNTKVSISPDQDDHHVPGAIAGAARSVKERIKEAASVLPNLGQGLSYSSPEPQDPEPRAHSGEDDKSRGPRELICDAYGKCKHKIANAVGRGKDGVSDVQEAAEKSKDRAYDVIGDAVRRVKDRAQNAKESVGDAAHSVKDRAYDATEAMKEQVSQKAKRAVLGDQAEEKACNAKEAGKEKAQAAKDLTVATGKTVGNHILSNVSVMMDMTEEALEKMKYTSPERLNQIMSSVNLLGFATAFGMSVWISFISSNLLARAIPRHQFGMVQSKVYPVYFKAMAWSIGAALLAHVLGQRKRLSDPAEKYQAYNLLVSLLMVLNNAYLIEPRATKIMFERIKIEKEEGRGRGGEEPGQVAEAQTPAIAKAAADQPVTDPAVTSATACASVPTPFPERGEDDRVRARADELNSKLKRFNSCSSLFNLLTFLGLTWHLVYLSQHLHNC